MLFALGLEIHKCFLYPQAREAWTRGLRGSQVFRDAEDKPKHPRVPKLGTGRVAASRDSGDGKMLLIGET